MSSGPARYRQEFNQVLDTQVHQPSYRAVEDHLSARYNGAQTGATRYAHRHRGRSLEHKYRQRCYRRTLVVRPDGTTEWVEIPKREWEDVYYESFARNSGFSVDEATRSVPRRIGPIWIMPPAAGNGPTCMKKLPWMCLILWPP